MTMGMQQAVLENDLHKATNVLEELNDNGIDINIITQKLEDEGIEKFNKAYKVLLRTIENKTMQVVW